MIRNIAIGAAVVAGLFAGAMAAPVMWTETACRAERVAQAEPAFLTLAADQRPEARTFLVYPEWHIVYAYEEYAAARADGPAHRFDYVRSISGFWSALCGVRAEADRLGDPGLDAKLTIYTIGFSFSLEMALKGIYEESVGRLVAWIGGDDTAQDALEREMARDYATFLHQVPWYRYDFDAWGERMRQAPVSGLRSWERRLAVGAEWKAKSLYADMIASAAGTMEPDETMMRIHVSGVGVSDVEGMPHVRVQGGEGESLVLDVDRYRVFTGTVESLAERGAVIDEIAGNDDILVSLIGDAPEGGFEGAEIVRTIARSDGDAPRILARVKVSGLADLVRGIDPSELRLEHVYDY